MGFFDSIKTGFGGGARVEGDPEQAVGGDAGEAFASGPVAAEPAPAPSAPAAAAPAPPAAQQEVSAELYRIYQRKRAAFRKFGEAVYAGEAANEELLGRYAGLVRDIRALEQREEELSDRLDAIMLGGPGDGWNEAVLAEAVPAPKVPSAVPGPTPVPVSMAATASERSAAAQETTAGDFAPAPESDSAAVPGLCPVCGAPLESDALFCAECGARIADAAQAPADHVSEAQPAPSDEEPGGLFEDASDRSAGVFAVADSAGEDSAAPAATEPAALPRCPACGAPLFEDALFCAECGARVEEPLDAQEPVLGEDEDGVPECVDVDESPTTVIDEPWADSAAEPGIEPAPAPSEAPFGLCPACGAPLEPDALFCAECGARVETAAAEDAGEAAEGPVPAGASAVEPAASSLEEPCSDDGSVDVDESPTTLLDGFEEVPAGIDGWAWYVDGPAASDDVASDDAASDGAAGDAAAGEEPERLCPTCGAPLEPDARFCAECGAYVESHLPKPDGADDGSATPEDDLPCPKCGAKVDRDAFFCDSCGALLRTAPGHFRHEPVEEPAGARYPFCQSCGAVLEPDALFCAECGARVEEPQGTDALAPDDTGGAQPAGAPAEPVPTALAGEKPEPGAGGPSEPEPEPAAAPGLCPACGAPLEPDALFCAECGARVEAAAGDASVSDGPDGLGDIDESPTTVLDEPQPDSAPDPVAPAKAPGLCPACGAPLEPDALFCAECGARVEEPRNTEPSAPAAPATCPVCGAPLEEGYRFCGECGAPVPDGGPLPEPAPAPVPEPRRCSICGAEASDDAFFCAECGARL